MPQLTCPSIWLHAALLDIVRTFVGTNSQAIKPWKSFIANDSSADAAYKASVNQLKRLILDYRTNYETSTYSILWHTGLLYLVNALLESPRDPDWHLYFLLCIYGYQSLRGPYRISESIGKSLLAMTLRDTDLPAGEAREILEQLRSGELSEISETQSAKFMADLKLAKTDPRSAQVENMAEEFESMALFNEIIEQNRMDFSE
jgi:phosphoribosylformylglycinamidine (FGAM) synthase PurS component